MLHCKGAAAMFLFGRHMTKREFLERFADVSQVGGIRSFTLNEGRAKGIDALEVNTGAGLRFTVLKDRGLDIGWADYKSVPIGFISKAGISSSLHFEHKMAELHRVFGPGLLTTCGLRNIGIPCVVNGEEFAQHGRVHNAPAENISAEGYWDGDEYKMVIKGEMREANLFGESLRLIRKIETTLGSSTFKLTDTVVNQALHEEDVCILYHINFGYPLVDEGASIVLPSAQILHDTSKEHMGPWTKEIARLDEPRVNAGRAYFMGIEDEDIKVGIRNEKLESMKGIYLRYKKSQLPSFTIWRNLTPGDYVVGLEPGTANPEGREQLLDKGQMVKLAPMEEKRFEIEFGIDI